MGRRLGPTEIEAADDEGVSDHRGEDAWAQSTIAWFIKTPLIP